MQKVRFFSGFRTVPLLSLATLLVAPVAHAELCSNLNLPNPIYGSGGSAATATIGKVATALAGLNNPITILFADPGACTGYQAFLDNSVKTPFKYWDATGTRKQCDPPPVVGQPVDFAHMANPASNCAGQTLPEDVGEFSAPVTSFNIVTSVGSSETSISSEALYFIYGWGAESQAQPWIVEPNLAKRKSDSAVHLLLAEALGLPASKFHGTEVADQQGVVDLITAKAANDPYSTLGYVSGSAADSNRSKVKTLAYQHFGQTCGYYPDSTESGFDKINVRKGQYYLWTPGHFFARINGSGEIVNQQVAELVAWFNGSVAGPEGTDITQIVSKAGDIPACAMQVKREGVLGAVSSYAPSEPCGCYFDFVTTGATSCEPCSAGDTGSGGQVCRNGYWEAY